MRKVSVPLTCQSKKHHELYTPQSIRKLPDGVVAALPDGIEMCQVCECKSSQSGKGGIHGQEYDDRRRSGKEYFSAPYRNDDW